METVVLIIMMMVVLSFVLRMTYHHPLAAATLCAVVSLTIGWNWDVAIEQSKTQIADWLADSNLMLNIAVFLTIDVAMAMAFCALQAQALFNESMTRWMRGLYLILKYIPGILIFPTMFALLVYAIFAFTGFDFAIIAWSLAAFVFIALLLLSYIIKMLLPETEVRLELTFLVNALIAVLGIIATVNGRTTIDGTSQVEWSALVGVTVILLISSAAGYLLYYRKNNR